MAVTAAAAPNGSLNFIKKAAPWIGTILSATVPGAAPFVSIASKLLSNGLGVPVGADAKSVSDAITTAMSSPDQLAKLKQIDNDFAVQMRTLGIQEVEDLEKIWADDRASARSMEVQTQSRIPSALAVLVTLGFFGLLTLTATHAPPASSEKVLDVMTGSLGTAWIMVMGFYFGSSAGSARKTELLAQAPPIPQ